MDEQGPEHVDRYLADLFVPQDPSLEAALARSDEAGLPRMAVSPVLGRLLQVLAHAVQATRILEIGMLGGYSTIWLARSLPVGGSLVSIELSSRHAEVARRNLEQAGVADRVEIRVGPAIEVLTDLAREGVDPFDLTFIDADKEPYAAYLEAAIGLSRAGSLIVADNVVRGGAVVEADSEDPRVQGVRRFNAALAADERLDGVVFQHVGVKGHDGLAIAVVR